MSYIIRYWGSVVFILSIIAISSALIAENVFNILPCKMCLYQRYTYYFIIVIFSIFYFFKKTLNLWLYIFIEIAVLYGLFYSIWHVGIEQKLLKGPLDCTGILKKTNSAENLKEQILNQEIINCSDISWVIFGLSGATINAILMLLFLFFNTIFIFKIYNEK